ncbi:hypothetical protein [Dactylosporangium sp. CA-139066]|uniref:hypothetical protein n=1 Tax=Dactylosporangium sp. CA-139066 TaxID=3239930 RepID=UPI003D8F6C0B
MLGRPGGIATQYRRWWRFTGEPQDLGFMYRREFADPDGNLWQVLHLDPTAVPTA